MRPMEAGPENSLDKHPALLVWSSWVCGTGMGFYILWPHTAAFSKQSTIIRSDKRANTVHSRVKKKHVPISLSSPFILRPYVALFSLTFSHFPVYLLVISLPLFFSIQSPAALESWGTFNTCTRNNASLSAPGTEPECCLYELISSGRKCLT